MNRAAILLFLLFPLSVHLSGQTRLLTVEEGTGMNPKLSPASLAQLQWRPGSDQFTWVAANALVQGSVDKPTVDTLVRLRDLNLLLRLNRFDTLKRFPGITYTGTDEFHFMNGNRMIRCDIMKNTVEEINQWDARAVNTDVAEGGEKIAFTRENNLYLSVRGKETEIAGDPDRGIVYGSERVHRNEFGISKGTFWSPDGKKIAFYRMDERRVTEYPLVDISTRIATLAPTRYPMAGMASHSVTLGVYDLKSAKTIYLKTEEPGAPDSTLATEYLTNVTWSPDGDHIYVATLNRDQNYMRLNRYRASDGSFEKTLFEERSEAYVEPLTGPAFLKGAPGKFIWESRRDGFNHLYLYDTEGTLVRQVTRGPWEVTDYLASDEQGTKIWFIGNQDNPLERHLFTADLKTGLVQRLTDIPGTHSARISDKGNHILDTWSSTETPRRTDLLDEKGKPVRTVLASENPLKEIRLGETKIFSVKNEEGDELYCRLIQPPDFDPAKKYPVIIYVYGGPHSQLVTNTWLGGGGLFLNYLVSRGYVVFTLDNRGTAGRGRDFEQAIFRNLGVKETADQMTGVRYLKTLDYVDTTRIGINGWSYGGFMTLTMFLKYPGQFRAAVCGGPVVDWKYYEVMYGERYMDTPESNPEGYRNACILPYVKNLQGRLLVIHDDMDGTVVPQNSLTFLKACVDEGKQVDFFMYPGHEHNVRGKDRVHLNTKIARYFQDNL